MHIFTVCLNPVNLKKRKSKYRSNVIIIISYNERSKSNKQIREREMCSLKESYETKKHITGLDLIFKGYMK